MIYSIKSRYFKYMSTTWNNFILMPMQASLGLGLTISIIVFYTHIH